MRRFALIMALATISSGIVPNNGPLLAESSSEVGNARLIAAWHGAAEPTTIRHRIHRDEIASTEWRSAIDTARSHAGGRGYYSLMRVFVDDSSSSELIQVQGTKLKELSARYSGGGGEFRTICNGEFVLFQHINSVRRRDGCDPIRMGAFEHGSSTIWVEQPPMGELGIVGDVILSRCPVEEMGRVTIRIVGTASQQVQLTIGPIVAGGSHGAHQWCSPDAELQLLLPPGNYKLLFPEFDLRASRWDVDVQSQKVLRLTFDVTNQKIAKTAETSEPLVSPKTP
jgi:hypothetical protein